MTEQKFLNDIDGFIEEFLHTNPTFATFAGDRRFDAKFGTYVQYNPSWNTI